MEFHVAEELKLKVHRPKSVDIYGTRNSCWVEEGELVMAGVVRGDCRDKMADRLPRSYR